MSPAGGVLGRAMSACSARPPPVPITMSFRISMPPEVDDLTGCAFGATTEKDDDADAAAGAGGDCATAGIVAGSDGADFSPTLLTVMTVYVCFSPALAVESKYLVSLSGQTGVS